jgi:hypothetical protein
LVAKHEQFEIAIAVLAGEQCIKQQAEDRVEER